MGSILVLLYQYHLNAQNQRLIGQRTQNNQGTKIGQKKIVLSDCAFYFNVEHLGDRGVYGSWQSPGNACNGQ